MEVHGESVSGPVYSLSWAGIRGHGVKNGKLGTRPKELKPWTESSIFFFFCVVGEEIQGLELARQVLYH